MNDQPSESTADLLARARGSQIRAWNSGRRILVEQLLIEFVELQSDENAILELLYAEYCLREEAGESPDVNEYYQRFGPLKNALQRLFEIHTALDTAADSAAIPTLHFEQKNCRATVKPTTNIHPLDQRIPHINLRLQGRLSATLSCMQSLVAAVWAPSIWLDKSPSIAWLL